MAEARTRIGRRAAIAGSLILAALLYATPVAAAEPVDASPTDSIAPAVVSSQGVEWTSVVRTPTITVRLGAGRTVLGVEWTLARLQPLGIEWTN